MSVITISREAGSFGDEIANMLSEKLGCKLLDSEKIKEIMSLKGIKKPVIEQFGEKTPGFFSQFSDNREKFLNYLSLIILEAGCQGDLIILGLGGQFMFTSQEEVVRIRITASLDQRISRISRKYECDDNYAAKLIQHVDHDREGYYKVFFGRDINDHNLYDIIINSDYITPASAVKLIKDACKFKNQQIGSFKDDYIGQKAVIKILYEKKIPVKNISVSFEKGVMILDGRVNSTENGELCTLSAKEIDGVEEVHNRITHKALNNYSIH